MISKNGNVHLTRLYLREYENSRIKVDASHVSRKEDFFHLMGLRKINFDCQDTRIYYKKKDVLKNIQVLPCRVVIIGTRCDFCCRFFKCKSDLDQHVKRSHYIMEVLDENTTDETYDKIVESNGKFPMRKNLRLVLKIGNEVMSKMDLNRKYLKMAVQLHTAKKKRKKLVDLNQRQVEAESTFVCDIHNERLKWLTLLQNGSQPSDLVKRSAGVAVFAADSELSIFRQEMGNIVRGMDNRIQARANISLGINATSESQASRSSAPEIVEIVLTDDDDDDQVVEINRVNKNKETVPALPDDSPDENRRPPSPKKKETLKHPSRKISRVKAGNVNNQKTISDNTADGTQHTKKYIRMIDALEEMKKMEAKGFYLTERRAQNLRFAQAGVDQM